MAFIRINKHNFYHNLNQLALKAGSKEHLAVVLKDNAYGHGLELVASLALEFGIKQAVVISTDEAMRVENFFEHILILNDTPIKNAKFSFAVTELEGLEVVDPSAAIELKIDTGMHRNGVMMDQIDDAIDIIHKRRLNLIGVMTHYRSADVLSSELMWQKKNFEVIKQRFRDKGFAVRFHSHNSAALLRSRSFDENIARVGIAIYGYNELPTVYDKIQLKPVLSLHARRTSTRLLKAGQRIGYGGDYTTPSDAIVSTYDIGYGDGWMRGDSTDPYITAEGLPVLGRVSMDFISLQTDKDSVCIMENAQKAAKHFGTISYEMTTMLSPEIERTYQ